eukprot:CAMPEP_0177480436 /NCGR_PEP_ID=MMETSP0369-20130122/25816_1 /TAXON_ID=447022 ORGANISM="Scrippsiella hangoei-like, Strain SHHI-4" /NCGR_SAMPLE_ID=MMETSP0369 /ASSEMBLY_ACC=CAM_ASM_000364 /LENGTH=110 /DNA_ID=CAMNT_0018956127 /DNA_START=148 /DNA_END=478 /DNA_ORIENTATION=+
MVTTKAQGHSEGAAAAGCPERRCGHEKGPQAAALQPDVACVAAVGRVEWEVAGLAVAAVAEEELDLANQSFHQQVLLHDGHVQAPLPRRPRQPQRAGGGLDRGHAGAEAG